MSFDWIGGHEEGKKVARFKSFSGGKEPPKSNGEDFQCDCPANGCSCSDWGPWVPKDQYVPNVVLCPSCEAGRHK